MTALTSAVMSASGGNCFWARDLPALVANQDLVEVSASGDQFVLRGGSPWARFFALTANQIRDTITGSSGSLSAEQLDEALTLLGDPTFWALAGAGIVVWGQRPTS